MNCNIGRGRKVSGLAMAWSGVFLAAALVCFPGEAAGAKAVGSQYADLVRELYTAPKSTGMAGSDMSFSRNGAPAADPASLPFDSMREISLSYANFFENTFSTSILSYVAPVGKNSGLGVSVNYFYVPDIELYRIDKIDTTSTGDPILVAATPEISTTSDILVRLSYGYAIELLKSIKIGAGVALNGQRRRLLEQTGYGIGLDVGVRANFPKAGASVAIIFENATTAYMYWNSSYSEFAYPHARIGAGWQREFPYIYGRLRMTYLSPDLLSNEGINSYQSEAFDSNTTIDTIPVHMRISSNPEILITSGKYGLEYTIMDRLALRLGLASGRISFGAGLDLIRHRVLLDFAYMVHELAGTYQLGVTYRW